MKSIKYNKNEHIKTENNYYLYEKIQIEFIIITFQQFVEIFKFKKSQNLSSILCLNVF